MALNVQIRTVLTSQFEAMKLVPLGYAVIHMLLVFYVHYDIALTRLLYSYPIETFPYELRSWGVTFTLIVTNASLIIGQVVNPIAMANIGWRDRIMFCVFFVAVWLILPETKGKSLEEVAAVLEHASRGNQRHAEKMKDEIRIEKYEDR